MIYSIKLQDNSKQTRRHHKHNRALKRTISREMLNASFVLHLHLFMAMILSLTFFTNFIKLFVNTTKLFVALEKYG